MSMPKRVVGRSRTWPLLATTSKSSPRYLLIVLALAGDSTMTRCFFFRGATAMLLQVRETGSEPQQLDRATAKKVPNFFSCRRRERPAGASDYRTGQGLRKRGARGE